jgi:hypothetical protein
MTDMNDLSSNRIRRALSVSFLGVEAAARRRAGGQSGRDEGAIESGLRAARQIDPNARAEGNPRIRQEGLRATSVPPSAGPC